MRIAMIGTGYVGLVSGTCLADFGHHVTCVDKDQGKIEGLLQGRMPIWEPGLESLVKANVDRRRLAFTTDLAKAIEGAEAVFIAVGTPSRRGDGHADLSFVFAAVEELENPDLRSKPLIVGGDPHGRGVVATANYEARKFGIGSAMSCAEALRRCPQAVFVRPRHSVYREYSATVWDAVREVVPTVERTGLDEGYLDFGEIAESFSQVRALAEAVQTSVRGATSLSAAIGVATSKVVAKIASDRRKPGGLTIVPPGREASFLAPFDVRRLPGVGPRSEARLRAAGLETIGALAGLSDTELRRLLPGKVGLLLRDRARGIDPRPLETAAERISISTEETFERDIADRAQLKGELRRMSVSLAEHLRKKGETARTVTTKVRYPDFAIRSRSTSLSVGTDDPDRISELACALLDRALDDRPGALRLVGVGLSGFEPHRQLALV